MRRIVLGLALAAIFATGCQGVVTYRGVQRDFQDAVMADNETTVSLAMIDAYLDLGYQQVFDTLTPEYIRGSGRGTLKEEKLRSNAWMLRAVCAWRLKKYIEATNAAEAGLELGPVTGSRDAVIMEMIPAVTRDSAIMDGWVDNDRSFTQEEYDGQRDNMAKAYRAMSKVKMNEATPESTRYYVYYQQWRLIQHWRQLIANVEGASGQDQLSMQQWVKTNVFGGLEMGEAANAVRDKIPSDNPLRKLMAAQGGG